MAIRFEDMPEANRQKALEIFGRQMRGEITQAQAEAQARANEREAQKAVSGGGGGSGLGTNRPGGSASAKRDCPIGYIWDEAKQDCVPDPNAYQNLPAFETMLDPMKDPSKKPTGAPDKSLAKKAYRQR